MNRLVHQHPAVHRPGCRASPPSRNSADRATTAPAPPPAPVDPAARQPMRGTATEPRLRSAAAKSPTERASDFGPCARPAHHLQASTRSVSRSRPLYRHRARPAPVPRGDRWACRSRPGRCHPAAPARDNRRARQCRDRRNRLPSRNRHHSRIRQMLICLQMRAANVPEPDDAYANRAVGESLVVHRPLPPTTVRPAFTTCSISIPTSFQWNNTISAVSPIFKPAAPGHLSSDRRSCGSHRPGFTERGQSGTNEMRDSSDQWLRRTGQQSRISGEMQPPFRRQHHA